MGDIFLSYSQKDRDRAQRVAVALRSSGWEVWWDANLYAGSRFRAEIATQLHAARCVVVLWSAASVTSDWVIDEAEDGKQRGVLVQAIIDPVRPPHGFGQIHYADLVNWRGGTGEPVFRSLSRGVEQKVPRGQPAAGPGSTARPMSSPFAGQIAAAAAARAWWFAGPVQATWKPVDNGLALEVTNTSADVMRKAHVSVYGLRWWNPVAAAFVETPATFGQLPIGLHGAEQLFSGQPVQYTFSHGSPDDTAVWIDGFVPLSLEEKTLRLTDRGRWQLDLRFTWTGGSSGQHLEFYWPGKGLLVPLRAESGTGS
jgi:hypothetical protein